MCLNCECKKKERIELLLLQHIVARVVRYVVAWAKILEGGKCRDIQKMCHIKLFSLSVLSSEQ